MSTNTQITKVSFWVRCLAIIYIACVAVVIVTALQQLAEASTLFFQRHPFQLVESLLYSYVTFLFGYVAITGLSPSRFFPLASLSWPLFSASNQQILRKFGIDQQQEK